MQNQFFFRETKIVLPISPDIEYLNEMKERANHSGLITGENTLDEDALLALVQRATDNESKDWHIKRAARTANLPQHDFDNMAYCSEMFLQQTVYSPISELLSCFDVSMYCADRKLEFAHAVGCKTNFQLGKGYQETCKPDAGRIAANQESPVVLLLVSIDIIVRQRQLRNRGIR
jgi:hypothetical protein